MMLLPLMDFKNGLGTNLAVSNARALSREKGNFS